MPPPPPPSASYLLKFDSTDDESGSDDEDPCVRAAAAGDWSDHPTMREAPPMMETPRIQREAPVLVEEEQPTAFSKETTEDEDESEEEDVAVVVVKKSKRKKKKKKKSKKKKKQQQQQPKHVAFQTVTVQEFARALGTDVVPLDGCWPLGLGAATASHQWSVEEYELTKQERLRCRRRALLSEGDDPSEIPLETRQWDYRCKDKNPLFRIQDERERMHLLLDIDDSSSKHSSSSKEPEKRGLMRRRSGRVADCSHRKQSSPPVQYNDVFTKLDVMHSRTELETIRSSRRMEGSIGCTCRKLNVYLLPPNAGKKAHHRRMNLPKVKDELRKRHLLPDDSQSQSRDELERLLHDAVLEEPCCAYDCPCSANGIGCQADACGCWRHSSSGSDHSMTAQEIETACGNPDGMYAVDLVKVDRCRRAMLANLQFCPVIEAV